MANPRLLDKRRRSIKNIRKITRTMELIATARLQKAMDASAATAYTAHDQARPGLLSSGLQVSHPLLEQRDRSAMSAGLTSTVVCAAALTATCNGPVIIAGSN
jgi:F-type H+-transporting ATPase subunit gamma